MNAKQGTGPTVREWANSGLQLTKYESKTGEETVYELRKRMVVNGVEQIQVLCLNQAQLRSIGIDHGL